MASRNSGLGLHGLKFPVTFSRSASHGHRWNRPTWRTLAAHLHTVLCAHLNRWNGKIRGPRIHPAAVIGEGMAVQTMAHRAFGIVENGVRLSGMPAFGKVETDEHIWQIVQYVRSLHPAGPSISNALQ
jgi:hypothetical protein